MAPLVPQQHEVHEDFTLSTLIQKIHTVLGPDGGLDSEHIDPNEIIHLMEQYSSNAKDWSKYTIFDHSRAYTRNLIDDGNGKVCVHCFWRVCVGCWLAILDCLAVSAGDGSILV